MATYFHGAPTEIQHDGLQTLYLMNPGYIGYSSDASSPANMLLLNSAVNSLNPANLSAAPQPSRQQQQQQQQHFVGIPLQAQVPTAQDPMHGDISAAINGVAPRLHYNLWTPTPTNNSVDMTAQLGLRDHSMAMPTQQGLSLSLSPQQQPNYALYRREPDFHHPQAPAISPASRDEARTSGSPAFASNGIPGLQSALLGSKYLVAAQQLLDEVVNVGKAIKEESAMVAKSQTKTNREAEDTGGAEASSKLGAELTTAERQELQMKKAKLVSMLDEVEQRYRQYHHQMQIVVSSFEAAAGFGSARTYTALALQTISKQFRCLRDAISGQIRAASKSLGEEDCLIGVAAKTEGGSRLRFVDHHLRQQRALQQIGMIQHNAWRPQRGLPERSVSVLRAWLFEHFLHPYPKDSDKHMLAKQTGLTRSQVSNWFINARVRLWKPMVEEMYLEETKEQEQQNNGEEKTCKSDDINEDSASKSSAAQESSPTRTEQTDSLVATGRDNPNDPNPPPIMIPSPASAGIFRMQAANYNEYNTIVQEKLKKARRDEQLHPNTMARPMNVSADLKPGETNDREFFMKFGDGRRGSVEDNGYSFITGTAHHGGSGGFGAYAIGDIDRFSSEQFAPRFSGNGVSLTLGLQHCDNLSLSGTQPSYLPNQSIHLGRRIDQMSPEANDYCSLNNNPSSAHSSDAFENISIQNRKRFAAQLLPDFVA